MALVIVPSTRLSAQTYQCLTTANAAALGTRDRIVEVVIGTDSTSTAARVAYHLPQTTASKVTVVTQNSKCATAAQHYYQALNVTPPTSGTIPVLLLNVGTTRSVVFVPSYAPSRLEVKVIFDSQWARLADISS